MLLFRTLQLFEQLICTTSKKMKCQNLSYYKNCCSRTWTHGDSVVFFFLHSRHLVLKSFGDCVSCVHLYVHCSSLSSSWANIDRGSVSIFSFIQHQSSRSCACECVLCIECLPKRRMNKMPQHMISYACIFLSCDTSRHSCCFTWNRYFFHYNFLLLMIRIEIQRRPAFVHFVSMVNYLMHTKC